MNKIVKLLIDRPLGAYHSKHEYIYYFDDCTICYNHQDIKCEAKYVVY